MALPPVTRLATLCFLLFAGVALLVGTEITRAIDEDLLRVVGSLRTPAVTSIMHAASTLGDWPGEVPLLLLVVFMLWWRGHPVSAWRFLAFTLVAELAMNAIKLGAQRQRPTIIERLSGAGSLSFPSGHATLAPVIWGFGLFLIAEQVGSIAGKRVLRTLAVAVPLTIALSRLYLGVHYPTDVLAGLALGFGWVLWWRETIAPRRDAVPVP